MLNAFNFSIFPQMTLLFHLLNAGSDMEEILDGNWLSTEKLTAEMHLMSQRSLWRPEKQNESTANQAKLDIFRALNNILSLLQLNNNSPFDDRYEKHLENFARNFAKLTGTPLSGRFFEPKSLSWDIYVVYPSDDLSNKSVKRLTEAKGTLREFMKSVEAFQAYHHRPYDVFGQELPENGPHFYIQVFGVTGSSLKRIAALVEKRRPATWNEAMEAGRKFEEQLRKK